MTQTKILCSNWFRYARVRVWKELLKMIELLILRFDDQVESSSYDKIMITPACWPPLERLGTSKVHFLVPEFVSASLISNSWTVSCFQEFFSQEILSLKEAQFFAFRDDYDWPMPQIAIPSVHPCPIQPLIICECRSRQRIDTVFDRQLKSFYANLGLAWEERLFRVSQ